MSHTPKSTLLLDTEGLSAADLTVTHHSFNVYSETYFDALYRDNSDPWQYQTRWYEKRKRDMCLAALPQATYMNAIELGCSNGVFSELLAGRCQTLLSIDGNLQAVQLAKQRLIDYSHVKVIQGVIPHTLSTLNEKNPKNNSLSNDSTPNKQAYDLIVISEILYYLPLVDIDKVITWIKQSLTLEGTLLCCHWRYDIDGFLMTGETVHQRLQQAFNESHNITLTHQSQIVDSDFLLDVWQRSAQTIAMQEQLI